MPPKGKETSALLLFPPVTHHRMELNEKEPGKLRECPIHFVAIHSPELDLRGCVTHGVCGHHMSTWATQGDCSSTGRGSAYPL